MNDRSLPGGRTQDDCQTSRVLSITSEAGWADTVVFGVYNVSKAALNSLGVSMAKQYIASFRTSDI
jgi:NAD(P)-dependent dehydrogenase (short-subunit alcohol dehydrogenase family)